MYERPYVTMLHYCIKLFAVSEKIDSLTWYCPMRTKAVPMLRMILKRTSFPVLGT